MVQIIPQGKTQSGGKERLNAGMEYAANFANQIRQAEQQQEAYKGMGLDPRIAQLPPEAQAQYFKQAFATEKQMTPLQESQKALADERLNALKGRQDLFNRLTESTPRQNQEGIELNPHQKNVLSQMPVENLNQLAAFAGQPGEEGIVGNIAKGELERREKREKSSTRKEEILRAETLPIRKEISDKAQLARQGIENKERAINIIEKGDVDDPTFAIFAELLPYNLGKRLLSNDTVEYKAGLIDDYGDLRKIFQGQTRVKEIELLEDKIADIYLTDDQKKAVLKSRINALKADIIREEAAAELEAEGKFYGALQFGREVEKRAKPKLEALFDKILDENKSIIKDAENQKKIPLDINDPDGKKIIEEIFIEAGKDWKKAEQLAKKKGYHW